MKCEYNLELDMPKSVRDMNLTDIARWLDSENRVKHVGKFNTMQMINILNNIFHRMGLDLDNEQFIFLLDDSKRLLCEASAGSGKTTISQLKMIKLKLLYGIDGSDILSIAYNDHAVEDMKKRHASLIESIMSLRIGGVKLSSNFICRTFHSNALAWVTEYASKLNIINKSDMIASDSDIDSFIKKAVNIAAKKSNGELNVNNIRPNLYADLVSYISFIEEKMLSVHDTVKMSIFTELGLSEVLVDSIVSKFNRMCEHSGKFTFSKIVVMFYELLLNNVDIRKRAQTAYKVLLVDEYQDMSPLMNSVLSLMIGDDTVFNAIGDGDQSIYGFKGTDSLNCIKFKSMFKDGKVVSMGANRRCKKVIVDAARNILSGNKLRYNKDIYSLQDGGEIVLKSYDNVVDEYSIIINDLRDLTVEELSKTCIAYRNKESSRIIARMLLDNSIPFHIKSGFKPYFDYLSRSLYDILMLLRHPSSRAYQLSSLYKVTSGSKKQIKELIDSVPMDAGLVHYLDLDWDSLGSISRSIKNSLSVLHDCEESIKSNAIMSSFFDKVFNIFKLYHWNWMKENSRFSDELENMIILQYNCELRFNEFISSYSNKMEILEKYERMGYGVRLTTFHGLKGLEFDSVYLVDMDESIFPNYSMIESEFENDPDAELNEKEEAVRLFYVACTRPKDKLTVLYNNDNPSRFIKLLSPNNTGISKYTEIDKMNGDDDFKLNVDGVDLSDGDAISVDDVLSFIDGIDFVDGKHINEEVDDEDDFDIVVEDSDSIDLTEDDSNCDSIEVADHTMYMYHSTSDSYYIIEDGNPLYNGSSIDFLDSIEITKSEYDKGIVEQEKYRNKLSKTVSMMSMFSS